MIYIIADDLTGASDTGVQYKRRRLRTLISAEIDMNLIDVLSDDFNVVSINAGTRTMLPQDAYDAIYELVKCIRTKEYKYIYKKIDSVLRGNVAQELEAVMDAMNAAVAVVATSYPENGRTLCNGILTISNTNSIKPGIDVIKLFADGMNVKVQGIGLTTVRQGKDAVQGAVMDGRSEGARVFVVDAVTDEDLAVVRDVSLALEERAILCGSAGLAKQLSLLETMAEEDEIIVRGKNGVTLVIIGSHNACTAEQVQALASKTGMPVITMFTSDILQGKYEQANQELLQQADNLISGGCRLLAIVVDTLMPGFISSTNDSESMIGDSLRIANAMGSFARQLCERYPVSSILSSGGDTSLAVLKALNAKGIELDAEIVPGVPAGRLIGGMAEGMTIVTKSGGFGKRDCLIHSIEYLEKKSRKKG
ncbi:MAG: four-carbon acid sugar kinase family protein [Caulobacteraceae bacterium]